MGTRYRRWIGAQAQEAAAHLNGEWVEVVLTNGHTLTGTLSAPDASGFQVTDINQAWYNRRKHAHRVAYTDVHELWAKAYTLY